MRIAILVEGRTERAFKPFLVAHLKVKLAGKMPKLDFVPCDGRVPTGKKLKRTVEILLSSGKQQADAVIALTDVYTGSKSPEFPSADDAKRKMSGWVGGEARFYPHVALHDFEAWLLPYWKKIQKITGSNKKSPGKIPEEVNHQKSPAYHLSEVFRTGERTRCNYIKTRDAGRILKDEDLTVAIEACAELRAFVDRIVSLS